MSEWKVVSTDGWNGVAHSPEVPDSCDIGDEDTKPLIYSLEVCPKCRRLKAFFEAKCIEYEETNMQTPEAMTELRCNGVFTISAPVLQVGAIFLTVKEMFKGNDIQEEEILRLVKPNRWVEV